MRSLPSHILVAQDGSLRGNINGYK